MKPSELLISLASALDAGAAVLRASAAKHHQVEGEESACSCGDITPEMLKAGSFVLLLAGDPREDDLKDLALKVYSAMVKVRKSHVNG